MKEKEFLELASIKLQNKGYKLTSPRIAILKYMVKEKGHHSIQEIYNNVRLHHPNTGMATIYRTIDLYLELGIARALILKNCQPCFEINWPDDHHHHLICNKCGRIVEFGSCNFKLIAEEIKKVTRFRIDEHILEAYGLCPRCDMKEEDYSTEKM